MPGQFLKAYANFPPLTALARIVWRRFHDDRCTQIAASLTFTTLLAIVPLITVALTLISAFPVFKEMVGALQAFVVDNMLPESADTIAVYAEQFTLNAGRLTAVGLVFLAVTAIMTLMTIDRAFNQIWRVSRPRPVVQRVLVYWALLTIGPVLIGASLTLTSWLVSQSLGLVSGVPGARKLLLDAGPLVFTSLAFALLYLTMPNRRIAVRDAIAGGVLAGLAFEAMKLGFAEFIAHFPTYKLVYGAFASVPIFLMWIYLSWLVVLCGAVVVAALPEWRARAGDTMDVPGSDFCDAIQILKVLWRAHHRGEVVLLQQLQGAVRAPAERIERILDTMTAAAWVSRAAPAGWVFARDPDEITAGDVYRMFAFRFDARMPARESDPELDALVCDISANIGEGMKISLERLFSAPARAESGAAPRMQAV
jgi:membrane protein